MTYLTVDEFSTQVCNVFPDDFFSVTNVDDEHVKYQADSERVSVQWTTAGIWLIADDNFFEGQGDTILEAYSRFISK